MTLKMISSLTTCLIVIVSQSFAAMTSYEKPPIEPERTPMVLAISTAVYEHYNTDNQPQISESELMVALIDLNKIFPKPPRPQWRQNAHKIDSKTEKMKSISKEDSPHIRTRKEPPLHEDPNIKGIGSGLMHHFDEDHDNLLNQDELTELFTHLGTKLPLNKRK